MKSLVVALLGALLLALPASAKSGPPRLIVVGELDDADLVTTMLQPEINQWLPQGTNFPNAFVDFSLCGPSRATSLTGLIARNHGVLCNEPPKAGWGSVAGRTWVRQLRAAGYRTILVGVKLINSYEGRLEAFGFDEWHILEEHGGAERYINPTVNHNGVVKSYQGYAPHILRDVVLDIVTRLDRPTAILWNFVEPHAPAIPAPEYAGACDAMAFPFINETDVSDKPSFIANLKPYDEKQQEKRLVSWRKKCAALRSAAAAWGDLLGLVKARGRWGESFMTLGSDNGFEHGAHGGYTGKLLGAYDGSIRVFRAAWGAGTPAGAVRRQFVSNTDLAPTLLDVAGVAPAWDMDGRSMRPLWEGNNATPGRSMMCGYGVWGWNEDAEAGVSGQETHYCHTENYRYAIHTAKDREPEVEFYDIDPETSVDGRYAAAQLTNVANRRGYDRVMEELRAATETYKTCRIGTCYFDGRVRAEMRKRKRR